MDKKIRVAIIGTGSISRLHINGYKKLQNVEVIAACDINKQRAIDFAKEFNIPNVFTDYHEMLKMKEIDAVSVTVWNNVHKDAAICAMENGKDVLCEKPLALNAAEAQEMVNVSKKTGKLLMVGFCKRFGENVSALKQMIDSGKFGKIYYAKTGYIRRWGNPGGWFSDSKRSGGGPVIDLGVHIIDVIRYLSGKPKAVSVMASTFNYMGMKPDIKGIQKYYSADYSEFNDVEDCAAAFIRFDNGMSLLFETSWVQNIKQDETYIKIYGDKAGADLEPEFGIYGSKDDYLTNLKPEIDKDSYSFEHNFNEEIKHFINCVDGKAECKNPAEDGLEIMKIIDAMYESARCGHEVIINNK